MKCFKISANKRFHLTKGRRFFLPIFIIPEAVFLFVASVRRNPFAGETQAVMLMES